MQVDDTAYPAPSLVPYNTVAAGAVSRMSAGYILKAADGSSFNLTTNLVISVAGGELVQPVSATLVVTAP